MLSMQASPVFAQSSSPQVPVRLHSVAQIFKPKAISHIALLDA